VKNKPILIVAGEPYSIFFEIFFKSIKNKIYKSPLILICCKKNFITQKKKFNFNKKIRLLDHKKLDKFKIDNNKINLIDIELQNSNIKKLKLKLKSDYIKRCFNLAFLLIKSGYTNKLINGPINKKTFLDRKFLGITEYIASNFNEKKIGMLIYNKKLSVSPLTTHLPLKLVSKKITKRLIEEKIMIINNFFKKTFSINPNIAVTGLNPHCESIHKFNEDEKIISSTIKSLNKKRINIKGPFPADTIFLKANRNKFDVILGMYHDQVLAPIKTLFEYDAINITMGLPFLRVTPDHGPNEKMFGKNKSNPLSLIQALKLDKR
jgi:4-hydroxythreonine-4-phosphate dehydrogenase